MNLTGRHLYSILIAGAVFFLLGAIRPTPRPTALPGPAIIIIPKQGHPSTFEFVRVYPDSVEVKENNLRMQFSRPQVHEARIPELGDLISQATRTIAEIEKADPSTFKKLIGQSEPLIPRLQSVVHRFDWLVPQASPALKSLEQGITDMRSSLVAIQNLSAVGNRIEQMANGSAPLSVTWEQQIDVALEETNRIPYLGLRKETLERFLTLRRRIRLDVMKTAEQALGRVNSLLEDLRSELRAGIVSEVGAQLLLKEIMRQIDRVPDPRSREEALKSYEEARLNTEKWFTARNLTESANEAQTAIASLAALVQASPPATLTDLRLGLQTARSQVSHVPASATRERLERGLSEWEMKISPLFNAPPPSPVVEIKVEAEPPASEKIIPAEKNSGDLLSDWRVWAIALLFVWFIHSQIRERQQKRRSRLVAGMTSEEESHESDGPVAAFPDYHPEASGRKKTPNRPGKSKS